MGHNMGGWRRHWAHATALRRWLCAMARPARQLSRHARESHTAHASAGTWGGTLGDTGVHPGGCYRVVYPSGGFACPTSNQYSGGRHRACVVHQLSPLRGRRHDPRLAACRVWCDIVQYCMVFCRVVCSGPDWARDMHGRTEQRTGQDKGDRGQRKLRFFVVLSCLVLKNSLATLHITLVCVVRCFRLSDLWYVRS